VKLKAFKVKSNTSCSIQDPSFTSCSKICIYSKQDWFWLDTWKKCIWQFDWNCYNRFGK